MISACARQRRSRTPSSKPAPTRSPPSSASRCMGAGGVKIPPASYWPEVQRICRKYDVLLMLDEVITGYGRTGEWFAAQTFGIEPDTITTAKALTSGYQPLSALLVGDRIAATLVEKGGEFNHGYTYSGHPVACAVALKNLEIIEREGLVERVRNDTGPYFAKALQERIAGHRSGRRGALDRADGRDRDRQGQGDQGAVPAVGKCGGDRARPRDRQRHDAARHRRHDDPVAAADLDRATRSTWPASASPGRSIWRKRICASGSETTPGVPRSARPRETSVPVRERIARDGVVFAAAAQAAFQGDKHDEPAGRWKRPRSATDAGADGGDDAAAADGGRGAKRPRPLGPETARR